MKRIQAEYENKIPDPKESLIGAVNEDGRSLWYIVSLSLAPLYLLIIVGAMIFALIMLDRHFISVTNFVFQQGIFITILIIGISFAITAYSLAIKHAHITIDMWRQNCLRKQAILGQLLLIIVASLMILPLILALVIR
jgi:hypothetical protein